MKQIHPHNYNYKYFSEMFVSPDYNSKLVFDNFSHKYQEIGNLIDLKSTDTVVDYGCGNGDLCFYLSLRFGCKCIGIDYAKTAIEIAKNNLAKYKKNFPKAKIKFYNCNNDNLLNLKNINTVYMTDVIEHMYDHEIKHVLKTFKTWNKNINVVIHTDNNTYLRYINPLVYMFQWFLNPNNRLNMIQNKHLTSIMHINLTTPKLLTIKMKKWKYNLKKNSFPSLTPTVIKKQTGINNLPPIIINIILFILKQTTIFYPSFYAIYSPVTDTDN